MNVSILSNVMFLVQNYDLCWDQNSQLLVKLRKSISFEKALCSEGASCELRVSIGIIITLKTARYKSVLLRVGCCYTSNPMPW